MRHAGDRPSLPDRIEGVATKLVFDVPVGGTLLVLMVVATVKDGFGSVPNLSYWLQEARAFPDRPQHFGTRAEYLLGSPVGPAVAHVLGLTSALGFTLLHLAVLLLAVFVLVIGLRRRGGRPAVGVGLVALFSSALAVILPTFLGAEDPWLVLFASAAVLFDSPIVLLVAGFGLGVSEIALAILTVAVVVGLRAVGGQSRYLLRSGSLVVGLAAGVVLTLVYERHGGAAGGEVAFIRSVGLRVLVRQSLNDPATWLYSILGAWWIVVVWIGPRLFARVEWAIVAGLALVAALLIPVSQDETRIMVLALWPAVLWSVLRAVERVPPAVLRRVTAWTAVAAVALPRIWMEAGHPLVGAWGHFG